MTPKRAPAPVAAAVEWRMSPAISQVLLVLWWGSVGWYYYHQPGYAPLWEFWPRFIPRIHMMSASVLWRDLKLLALLLWLIGLGHGLGRALLRRWGMDAGERIPMFLLSLAVGWGLMGLAMLGLGLLHLWNFPLVLACLVLGTLALGADYFNDWRRGAVRGPTLRRPAPEPRRAWVSWDSLWLLVLAFFAGFNLLAAFMPEIFYDALTYHLALPDLYWRRGAVVATPENIHSGFPFLVQMLYGIALPLGGDGLANLIHWAFGLGTALWVYALCRRVSLRAAAWPAALLFYSTPIAGILSWKAAADLGWAFYQMSALYALSLRLSGEPGGRRWTALAGFLAGLAMGTKYQAWPMLPVLLLALAAAREGRRPEAAQEMRSASWAASLPSPALSRENLRELGLFAGVALLTLAPWCLKNLLLYGNPIYPFLHEYFSSGPVVNWRVLLQAGGGRDIFTVLTTWEGLKSYLLHPWHLVFRSTDVDSMGPSLLLGLPLLFLCRFGSRPLRALWLALMGLWGVWSLTGTLSRFLLPHVPLAGLLIAAALEGLDRRLKPLLRTGLFFVFCANAFWLTSWLAVYGAEGAILGLEPRSEYLKKPHPSYARPPYAAIEFVNARLPRQARVLFIGEARSFYCERDRISQTAMDPEPLLGWIRQSRGAEELRDLLRGQGLTHVLVNRNEFALWQRGSDPYLPLDPRSRQVFEEFIRKFLRLVFEDKGPPRADFSAPWTEVYELAL